MATPKVFGGHRFGWHRLASKAKAPSSLRFAGALQMLLVGALFGNSAADGSKHS